MVHPLDPGKIVKQSHLSVTNVLFTSAIAVVSSTIVVGIFGGWYKHWLMLMAMLVSRLSKRSVTAQAIYSSCKQLLGPNLAILELSLHCLGSFYSGIMVPTCLLRYGPFEPAYVNSFYDVMCIEVFHSRVAHVNKSLLNAARRWFEHIVGNMANPPTHGLLSRFSNSPFFTKQYVPPLMGLGPNVTMNMVLHVCLLVKIFKIAYGTKMVFMWRLLTEVSGMGPGSRWVLVLTSAIVLALCIAVIGTFWLECWTVYGANGPPYLLSHFDYLCYDFFYALAH
jgi:hypothetical protein